MKFSNKFIKEAKAKKVIADMYCTGCGNVMASMYRMSDDQACPKCGGKLVEGNGSNPDSIPKPNSNMPNNMDSSPSIVEKFLNQNQTTPSGSLGNPPTQIF